MTDACRILRDCQPSELFEQIITQLPPEEIPKLKRVSSIWREAIERSSPIRQAMVLQTLQGSMDQINIPSLELLLPRHSKIPCYNQAVRWHSLCKKWLQLPAKALGQQWTTDIYWRILKSHKSAAFRQHQKSYATIPPCQAIMVTIPGQVEFATTIYIENGITLRDLADVLVAEVSQTLRGLSGRQLQCWVYVKSEH